MNDEVVASSDVSSSEGEVERDDLDSTSGQSSPKPTSD